MKRLVIFDLDGTLLDTIADLGAAANHALLSLGMPTHGIEAYKMMVGNGVDRLLERAMPAGETGTDDEFRHLKESFHKYYDEHCMDYTRPYEGIPQLLGELRDAGVSLAVTSNKYQSAVTRIVTHYFPDIRFAALLGKKEGVPAKPDPSIVFEALSLCPTLKGETLYVGDSGVDMETARRACVESAGVTWGFRPVKELREALADHIVTHPSEILDIVRGGIPLRQRQG